MALFKVSDFVTRSISEGYCKTETQAMQAILKQTGVSFANKLKEQKMYDENDKLFVAGDREFDTIFVCFRNKFFELNINFELLAAGLDPHFFTLVTDSKRITGYEATMKKGMEQIRPKKELELGYGFGTKPAKELLN
jgi:hypothetical protein